MGPAGGGAVTFSFDSPKLFRHPPLPFPTLTPHVSSKCFDPHQTGDKKDTVDTGKSIKYFFPFFFFLDIKQPKIFFCIFCECFHL